MNTVAAYCYAESQERNTEKPSKLATDGKIRIRFNELDALMEDVRRSGLCRNQPLILHTWSRPLEIRGGADFCVFAGGARTVP